MSKYQATEGINNVDTQNRHKLPEVIPPPRSNSWMSLSFRKYRNVNKCITSKSALLILLWILLVSIILGISYWGVLASIYYSKSNITTLFTTNNTRALNEVYDTGPRIVGYITAAFVFCFYPLAGFLADNRFGRYKTVTKSLYLLTATLITAVVVLVILVPIFLISQESRVYIILQKCLAVLVCFSGILILFSIIGFHANIIQFGMDQLYDSPGDHQNLFIYWAVWAQHFGFFISWFVWMLLLMKFSHKYIPVAVVPLISLITLIGSLYVGHRNQHWFLIDSAKLNPYKLVYQVTKFAYKLKVPIRRSAFTYCEDDVPSGLDLGKSKYGGPYTTEQVEDVKAFYGILKVLFAMGPVFFLEVSVSHVLLSYYLHLHKNISINFMSYLLGYSLLSEVLVITGIPVYVFVVRPFIQHCLSRMPFRHYCLSGMLPRLGLGITLMVTSLVCSFAMDTSAHSRHKDDINCMFTYTNNSSNVTAYQDTYFLIVQNTLTFLSTALIYIALYEFICSQSPHSMKGLLIGLSFAIKGIFQVIAALIILPKIYRSAQHSYPSCGMYYYMVNIVLGIIGFLIFVFVSWKYKFRKRDEECNIYRYAEEYFSKEENYEYLR